MKNTIPNGNGIHLKGGDLCCVYF